MCNLSVGGGEKHNTNDGHEKKDKTQNENEMTVNLLITSTHGKLNSEPRKYKWKQMSREELAASHQIQIQTRTQLTRGRNKTARAVWKIQWFDQGGWRLKDMLLGIWFETSKVVISRISVLKGPRVSVCIHRGTSCGTASLFGR